MEYALLKEFIKEHYGTLTKLGKCLGHSHPNVTTRVLQNVAKWNGNMATLKAVADCIGVPAWYMMMRIAPDGAVEAFEREEASLLADLKRIAARNKRAAQAYLVELIRRGKAGPAVRTWADENLT